MSEKNQTEEKQEDVTPEVIIEELEKQVYEEKERTLMALAELDNYKKRVQKEKEEMNLFANASILNILLEVMDDLGRGLGELEEVPVGLSMIQDKVSNVLVESGVEEVEINVGDNFDPKKMEAISTITVPEDDQNNKVIHIERKGYKIKDKDFVIRGSRVVVGKK